MGGVRGEPVVPSVEEQIDAVLVERVRLALRACLVGSIAFVVLTVFLGERQLALYLIVNGGLSGFAALLLYWLGRSASRDRATVATLLVILALCTGSAAGGIVRGEVGTAPLLITAAIMATALACPWGAARQVVAVLIGSAAMLANVLMVHGSLTVFPPATFVAASIPLGASIWLAWVHVRSRERWTAETLARQRAEALLEGERWFRGLVRHSYDVVALLDEDLNVVSADGGVERSLGYSPEQVVNRQGPSFLHPEDGERVAEAIARIRQPGMTVEPAEVRVLHADGSWVHFEFVGTNLLDDPAIRGIVVNARDITERKRSEAEREVLLEITQDISGTLDLEEILARVQRRVASVLPCDRVGTFYWDSSQRVSRVISHYGFPAELAPEVEAIEFRVGDPVFDYMGKGHNVIITDASQQSVLPVDLLKRLEIQTAIGLGLVVRGRTLGVLTVCRTDRERPFQDAEVQLCEGIARHVGLAIEAAELYRVQRAEAEVSGALARVGQEVIAALDTPRLLSKLCELVTEVLQCDASHTVLWKPEEDAFVPVAGYGDTPEQWETLRLIKLPRAAIGNMLERLEKDEVVPVVAVPDLSLGKLPGQYGITAGIIVPLRRGAQIIGFQVAEYRQRSERFTRQQERIAQGVAHLSSLALEHARLVDELESANRLKSNFVANMSHELRSPLNVILGYHELLRNEDFGALTPEQGEVLERIGKSARELLDLVNVTLDLSRLDAKSLPLDLRSLGVADILDDLMSVTKNLPEKPNVQVEWDVSHDLPRLHTDPLKLRMALKNLLENAIKFTDRGRVTVRAKSEEGGVCFEVSDTGPGVAPQAQAKIFEPFYQEDSAASGLSGVGLGLYIVRQLIEALGGTIRVDSDVGVGSTFQLWVPLNPRDVGDRRGSSDST